MTQLMRHVLVIVFLSSATAADAAEPFQAIPSDVALVVRFQSINSFLGGVNDLFTAIGPPTTNLVKDVERGLAADFFELDGDLNQLRRDRPTYAAVYPIESPVAPVVWFVQANSEKALLAALKKDTSTKPTAGPAGFKQVRRDKRTNWYFRKVGSYYAYTIRKELAEAVAKVLEKRTKPLKSLSEAQAVKRFTSSKHPSSIIINVQELAVRFQNELAEAQRALRKLITDSGPQTLGALDPETTKRLYLRLLDGSFQAIRDTRWIILQGSLGSDGGLGHAHVAFKPNSLSATVVNRMPTSQLDNLALLPAGAPIYAGYELGLAALEQNLLGLPQSVTAKTKVAAALRLLRAGKRKSQVICFRFPNDNKSGYQVIGIEAAGDAKKYHQGFTALMQNVGTITNKLFRQTIRYKPTVEKHKAHSIDLMSTKLELLDPNLKSIKGIVAKAFGGDTLQTRITRIDNLLVSASGNNPSYIRSALDRITSGKKVAGLNEAFAQCRDKLGDNLNLVFMIDVARTVLDGLAFIRDVPPFSFVFATLPINVSVKTKPSYIGLGVTKVKDGIRATVYVPKDQPQALIRLFSNRQ